MSKNKLVPVTIILDWTNEQIDDNLNLIEKDILHLLDMRILADKNKNDVDIYGKYLSVKKTVDYKFDFISGNMLNHINRLQYYKKLSPEQQINIFRLERLIDAININTNDINLEYYE